MQQSSLDLIKSNFQPLENRHFLFLLEKENNYAFALRNMSERAAEFSDSATLLMQANLLDITSGSYLVHGVSKSYRNFRTIEIEKLMKRDALIDLSLNWKQSDNVFQVQDCKQVVDKLVIFVKHKDHLSIQCFISSSGHEASDEDICHNLRSSINKVIESDITVFKLTLEDLFAISQTSLIYGAFRYSDDFTFEFLKRIECGNHIIELEHENFKENLYPKIVLQFFK
jgi:hypothetical protein